MGNLIDDILSNLITEEPERYLAPEYNLAQRMIAELEPKISMGIPYCVYDYIKDENGDIIMEEVIGEDGNPVFVEGSDKKTEKAPARSVRLEALAILVWIPALRERPEITLEEITNGIGADNLSIMTRSAYSFWGVLRKEEVDAGDESGEAPLEEAPPSEGAPLET